MTPDYSTMLRTAAQVQGAMSAAFIDLASRWCRFSMSGVAILARSAIQPLRVPIEQRQNALEDSIWTAYTAHEELLRAAMGASRLALLIYLNELDLRRGVRPARPDAD
jgi:hypothetical protein